MKYKIYDSQLGCYAFQEHIFKNKSKAVEQLVSFFSADCWGDLTKIRATLWKQNEFMDLEIKKLEDCEE